MSSKTNEFNQKLGAASDLVYENSVWRHYKGGVYKVNKLAINCDTLQVDVVYKRIDGPDFHPHKEDNLYFTRPLAQWFDMIEVEGLGAPERVQRFKRVRATQRTVYIDA